MSQRVDIGGLNVDAGLASFVNEEALPGSGVEEAAFWKAFEAIIDDLAPKNRELLEKRESLQAKIDEWYKSHGGTDYSLEDYKTFLSEILTGCLFYITFEKCLRKLRSRFRCHSLLIASLWVLYLSA